MRILHMIGTLNPEAGGPTEVVRMLVEHGPAGYLQEVVTLDDPAAPYVGEFPVPVHGMGPLRSTYGYAPKLLPWLRVNRGRFDGVIVHGLWQYLGLAAWRAFSGRVPYAVYAHGMLDPYFKRRFPAKHATKWGYWLLAEYRVLRGARWVVFTSDAEAKLAQQSFWLHRWRALVAPIGTVAPEDEVTQRQAQREAFLAVCPAVRSRRFLLFLGRIDAKKGCDLLVSAFAKLAGPESGQASALDLVVAGPDARGWRTALERVAAAAGVAGCVHWPGMLRGDAKWGALLAAEAFVLPSHQENFGVAVAEALACGTPVLVSDKVNIAAEIAADGAGLMEPDTAAGTERLLARWLELGPDERAAMSQRALGCFHRRYDMRENAKVLGQLFGQGQS